MTYLLTKYFTYSFIFQVTWNFGICFVNMGDANRNVLLTGGAGYIGIHCIVSLVKSGYTPIIADNMYNAVSG